MGYEETASWLICSGSGEWVPAIGSFGNAADVLCIPKSCPDQIPNGALSESCSAKVGSSCDYSCDSGFLKSYTNIECETSTNWSIDPHALCKHKALQQCPYEVQNGDLELTCRRRPGDMCIFTCREGYTASQQQTVYCNSSLQWSQPIRLACKPILCPLTIPNGYIEVSCSRGYGDYCYDYECSAGYIKPSASPGLKCNASGQWEWNESQGQPCFREEDMCPSRLKNGTIVWHCNRQPGSTCTYRCDPGCTQDLLSVAWLHCGQNGHWIEDTDSLCTNCRPVTTTTKMPERLCPATFQGGRIVSSCDRRPYSRCHFTCDSGCRFRANSLFCQSDLYWRYSSSACECSESSTPSYSSPTGNAGSAVIGGVVGAVVFVIIVVSVCVAVARNRQRRSVPTQCTASQRSEYQNSMPSRPTLSGMPVGVTSPNYGITSPNYGITSPNYANYAQETYYSSLQPQQNSESNPYAHLQPPSYNNNGNVVQGPPVYSSIAPSIPTDAPPSYEQVTANPADFKV